MNTHASSALERYRAARALQAELEVAETRRRIERRATRRAVLAMVMLLLGLAALSLLAGCESRSFTVTRPDGTTIDYDRVTMFGDSNTEGVSVSRVGDDVNVEVGATGSTSNAEQMLGLILDLARAGAAAGGVPVP